MTSGKTTHQDHSAEDPKSDQPQSNQPPSSAIPEEPELDDFGLPQRPVTAARPAELGDSGDDSDTFHDAEIAADTKAVEEEDSKEDVAQGTKANRDHPTADDVREKQP